MVVGDETMISPPSKRTAPCLDGMDESENRRPNIRGGRTRYVNCVLFNLVLCQYDHDGCLVVRERERRSGEILNLWFGLGCIRITNGQHPAFDQDERIGQALTRGTPPPTRRRDGGQ